MSNTKTILVATREIVGGTEKGGRSTLKAHEELTSKAAKALGLGDAEIASLIEGGSLIEVPAHISDDGARGDSAALKAEKDRADKAEQALAAANEEIANLKTQLEEAAKAAAKNSA